METRSAVDTEDWRSASTAASVLVLGSAAELAELEDKDAPGTAAACCRRRRERRKAWRVEAWLKGMRVRLSSMLASYTALPQ
jgi:hypothetical protein